MKHFIGFILLLGIVGFGYYYYTGKTFSMPTSLSDAYQHIKDLPNTQKPQAFQVTMASWIKDPSSAIPYPKGWKKISVTVDNETFDAITSNKNTPPQYYVSLSFPKKLVKKMHLIKCIGTSDQKTTDICAVGDNPDINAYYNIVDWIRQNPITNAAEKAPTVEM